MRAYNPKCDLDAEEPLLNSIISRDVKLRVCDAIEAMAKHF